MVESGLQRAVKAFDKDTHVEGEEVPRRTKKAKALADVELTEACQAWLEARKLALASGSPRFLATSAKEVQVNEELSAEAEAEAEIAQPKKKKAKKNQEQKAEEMEEAVQEQKNDEEPAPIEESLGRRKSKKAVDPDSVAVAEEDEVPPPQVDEEAPPAKKAKKGKKSAIAVEEERVEQQQAEEVEAKMEEDAGNVGEEAVKKTKKKGNANAKAEEVAEAEPKAEHAVAAAGKEEKLNKQKAEKKTASHYSRIDNEKWLATIKDQRLMNNTHEAKLAFGSSAGDGWGNKASEDLLKVKGKGFRKEMAKKKRASWRGGGEIDQGVNSIAFPDSDDE